MTRYKPAEKEKEEDLEEIFGESVFDWLCPYCEGKGYITMSTCDETCSHCNGTGIDPDGT